MSRIPYFLIDNTNPHLANSIPQSLSLEDVGLSSLSTDEEIFGKAIDKDLIIVTRNVKHFVEINRNGYHRSGNIECGGGRGLLVVNEKSPFDYDNITNRLKFNSKAITWDDVMRWNFKVSINNGAPDVQQLPNCETCVDMELESEKHRKRFKDLGLIRSKDVS